MKWTETNAIITVDTGREGPFASKGHDIHFEFRSFEISYTPDKEEVVAVVSTDSLSYLGVIEDNGEIDAHGLSSSDQDKVVSTAKEKVLKTKSYPSARFEAKVPDLKQKEAVSGKLTLCGVTCPLTFVANLEDDKIEFTFSINQSDFGIKQYSALLGALKVSDPVKIHVSLEMPEELK